MWQRPGSVETTLRWQHFDIFLHGIERVSERERERESERERERELDVAVSHNLEPQKTI